MHRRTLLTALGAGMSALAGCGSTLGTSATETEAPTATPEVTLASQGLPGNICEQEMIEHPLIPAIVEPAFAPDYSDIDVPSKYRVDDENRLIDDQTVIGLTDGERARAYPLEILWHHEIVNDWFGTTESGDDRPVLVTYCPLCRSGVVADRTIRGEPTNFIVTGLLWQAPQLEGAASVQANRTFGANRRGGRTDVTHSGNLVMYDEATRSYWSQILAEAICGPLRGQRLEIVPSSVATWGEWKADHPETDVLLPPPHSEHVPP